MELKNLRIDDGQIQKITSTIDCVYVIFQDWQGTLWNLKFDNVIAIENFSIEGEDVGNWSIQSDNEFITLARNISQEPDLPVFCYSFFSAWTEKIRLRIVASNCEVSALLPS